MKKFILAAFLPLISVYSSFLLAQDNYEKDSERDKSTTALHEAAGAGSAESASYWKHLHDRNNWQFNIQATYLYQWHPSFSAAYDGPHSLVSTAETGYTLTSTLFLGFRPWNGGEVFFNPEMIQTVELSHLYGLGGLSNSENQKTGGPSPKVYHARLYFRQTFDMGGDPVSTEAGSNLFANRTTKRRLVLSAGQMALIDIFDNNSYAHDGRTQFMNWSLLTYGASDYAADARGYTYGIALEYYFGNWASRFGRFAQPKESNGLAINSNIFDSYGDSAEVEHSHSIAGKSGKIRVLGFRNHSNMGRFDDALEYSKIHGGTPDIANVRKLQTKLGFGIALEQSLSQDVGLFARYSWNDGRTETYAFTEIERSLTVGASMRGGEWRRPGDTIGIAFAQNGVSKSHQDYLAAGGLGNFIGDGRLNYMAESIIEAFYSFRVCKGLWLSGGQQLFWNPAYNRDRGPVGITSVRMHFEFQDRSERPAL